MAKFAYPLNCRLKHPGTTRDTIYRDIAITRELGNGSLATYEMVKDPPLPASNILGMFLGVRPLAKVA